MDLIDRYVYQVGRRLPKRLRDDVKAELRSLLLDALEERTGRQAGEGAAFSEDEQVAVLEEFGPPAHMAEKYQPQARYIIGPKLYDAYLIVVAIVLGAGLLASLISAAVPSLFGDTAGMGTLEFLAQAVARFFNIALNGIGSTTLIFAVLERVIPEEEFEEEQEKSWDPRDLPAVEAHNQIKPVEQIVQIAILSLLLIAFIAFPEHIGTGAYYDGEWYTMPSILSQAFYALILPLIEVRWGLTILLSLVLLRQGRWQLGTRIADLLLQGLDIFILSRLALGPSILRANLWDMFPVLSDVPVPPLDSALRLAFIVALTVTVIKAVVDLYRLVRPRLAANLPALEG